MPTRRPGDDVLLKQFASFLRGQCLDDLAAENLRLARLLDVPLMRLYAHLPEDHLLELSRQGLDNFLGNLEAGTALAAAAESLRLWERDELPGLRQEQVEPGDLVLLQAAQKQAMLACVGRFTSDPARLVATVQALESFYIETQHNSFQVFARLREQAAHREIAKLEESEHEVAAQNEELTAANEELVAQAEELERQREEIVVERNLSHAIIENLPGIFAMYDEQIRLVRCNRRYAEGLGRSMDEMIGKDYSELVPGSPYRPKLVQVLETGVPWSDIGFPGRGVVEGHFYDFVVHPLLGRDGRPVGVLMQSFDVTERVKVLDQNERLQRERVDQLLQVDRQKDQFLGILSHELRTPLNAILGFASVLADEVSGPLSPLQHQHMGKILGGTEVLLALINDLLDMSRIQAGKFTLSVGPMDFGRVAATALENLAGLAENRQLTLVNEVPAGLPSLVADEQRVSQILLNLLGNAIKFTPAGGVVTLRAASNGGQLRVEVADTGPGIPPEDLPRLFHPFTQLDMSATRPASGTGLGLSIVKALAEAHGGQVGVTSVLGHGATFWFTLPTG